MMIVWPALLLVGIVPAFFWWRDKSARESEEQLTTRQESGSPAILTARLSGKSLKVLPSRRVSTTRCWRFWVGIALLILALASPQWEAPEQHPGLGSEVQVVLVLDYSEGMLADDLQPSRLLRARSLSNSFLDGLPGVDIALVGYAGEAHLLSPMSRDQAATRRLLASLAPKHFVQKGADLDAALSLAVKQFNPRADNKLILLVSLGEMVQGQSNGRTLALPSELQSQGIELLVVGAGTTASVLLRDEAGLPRLSADGAQQYSSLNRDRLQSLANNATGRYVEASDQQALKQILEDTVAEITSAETPGVVEPSQRRIELFIWVLLGSILFLVWSMCREFSSYGVLAFHWRQRHKKSRAVLPSLTMLILLAGAAPERGQADGAWMADLHPGDPYVDVWEQVQQLAVTKNPSSSDYLKFAEGVVAYASFHRGHAHAVIDSLLYDGFIAINLGQALDKENPAWDKLKGQLLRLSKRAPATRPPDSSPADPANEQVDADVLVGVAAPPAPPPSPPDPGMQPDSKEVGGGQAKVFDEEELTNPGLVLPLHQLQVIRELATPADLFRARQEKLLELQGSISSESGTQQ